MKKLLSATCILALMTLASCSFFEEKVIPEAKEKASEILVKAIVKEGQCSGEAAVKADVDKLLKVKSSEGENLVVEGIIDGQEVASAQPQSFAAGPIVSGICKSAVSLAIPALIKKGVPSEWGCALTNLSAKLEGIALGACSKI